MDLLFRDTTECWLFRFVLANHNSKSLSFDHPNNTETNFDYAAQLASVEPLGHIDILHFNNYRV